MAQPSSYYFTVPDPDYAIKGSRDPLGFQVLWQQQAKKLIPYLSTVSANLRDFQVMSLAYHLYEKEPDNGFIPFFIRFEQLMAYARYQHGETRMNGTRKVAQLLADADSVRLSTNKADQILTNQRIYGIWGKYNRPFQDAGILKDPDFTQVFSSKLERLPNRDAFLALCRKLMKSESLRVPKAELKIASEVFSYTGAEKELYSRRLLMFDQPWHLQNRLYEFAEAHRPEGFSYKIIQAFKRSAKGNAALVEVLDHIEATERLLCPLNRVFRYLQTKPVWSRQEIERNEFIGRCLESKGRPVFPFNTEHEKTKNRLSQALASPIWEIVLELVNRNKQVASEREGAPWMTINGDVLEVHHADGGGYDPDYDPKKDFDNDYFFNTYFKLFSQIAGKK